MGSRGGGLTWIAARHAEWKWQQVINLHGAVVISQLTENKSSRGSFFKCQQSKMSGAASEQAKDSLSFVTQSDKTHSAVPWRRKSSSSARCRPLHYTRSLHRSSAEPQWLLVLSWLNTWDVGFAADSPAQPKQTAARRLLTLRTSKWMARAAVWQVWNIRVILSPCNLRTNLKGGRPQWCYFGPTRSVFMAPNGVTDKSYFKKERVSSYWHLAQPSCKTLTKSFSRQSLHRIANQLPLSWDEIRKRKRKLPLKTTEHREEVTVKVTAANKISVDAAAAAV